jgi:CRISPR-associated endonuclease/helicase Cas3
MHVLIVSECSGNALKESRRILDQFAERKGERTWQTAITLQGLTTLRKMLTGTARKNTAVACHWIKSNNRTELLWIVGKIRAFNEDGIVPTNTTARDVLRVKDENSWRTIESIAILSGMAGLFHDFGKASDLFQQKLAGKSRYLSEPYRHEWISLRLFQALVRQQDDKIWLTSLIEKDGKTLEESIINNLVPDIANRPAQNPFNNLHGIAKAIGWLILSHHRLPAFQQQNNLKEPPLDKIDSWLISKRFDGTWNSSPTKEDWVDAEWRALWMFKHGLPLISEIWCQKAKRMAQRALKHHQLFEQKDWLTSRFAAHIARLSLMLGDHTYSAGPATEKWGAHTYSVYANTEKDGKFKQKLDEHNIGVSHAAYLISKCLPKLKLELPSISRHRILQKRTADKKFQWQDRAFDLVSTIATQSTRSGFFGINLASTGTGKTFANAKIMYALANDGKRRGTRFTVALGLRTLTLQTGDSYRERLKFDSSDLAVLLGSSTVRELHELKRISNNVLINGSESATAMFTEHQYVQYDGAVTSGHLSDWLSRSPKLHRLLSAPILVCTIDQMIAASESARGGHQIAPMLRLLTSDLVLDEPDDFDIADFPALCRFVNWAGMLGSRVLLSSATLPPSLVSGLFDAYLHGRRCFNDACVESSSAANPVVCCWFDEFLKPYQSDHTDVESFSLAHNEFVAKRVEKLLAYPQKRISKIIPLISVEEPNEIVKNIAYVIRESSLDLHALHHQVHPQSGQKVSFGVVRFANIKPLTASAQEFLKLPLPNGFQIYFCGYHSQFPLLARSKIENVLDRVLSRHNHDAIWDSKEVKEKLQDTNASNVMFVVFATAVVEVGRDHDYDWAIIEPSSMRSIIQMAGRVLRHRDKKPEKPNIHLLEKNYRGLTGASIAFNRPGFESADYRLTSHSLFSLLRDDEYLSINAIPRIKVNPQLDLKNNLVDLEHLRINTSLYGDKNILFCYASLWWKHEATWSAELQRRTRFRSSRPRNSYFLIKEDEDSAAEFFKLGADENLAKVEKGIFKREVTETAFGVKPWLDLCIDRLLIELALELDSEVYAVSRRFTELCLPVQEEQNLEPWIFDPLLGVYQKITT